MATEHKPFIPSSANIPELNLVTILTGVILGIIFGASSLYLALKVGLTVSASIPVAVLSVTLFRGFSKVFKIRKATILENNIVQTGGSAGESIAFGVAATMPALLIMGFEMSLGRTMLVAVLGSLLGVLMMIPLRRVLIVKEHDTLIYPEGTACAEVLISGEKGGTSAKMVFTGFFVGLIYKFLNIATKLWVDTPEKVFSAFKGANISSDVSPELLGVGYIIGPRIGAIMMGGGVLSSFVLIPLIVLFGDHLTTPLFPATKLISEMDVHDIWKNYILYIGAGAVAAGGIVSLVTSLPTIVRGAVGGLGSIQKGRKDGTTGAIERIDRDIPNKYVWGGSLLLLIAIVLAPTLHMNVLGGFLILAFGFLFVTVSSRLTGEIGSSSNPVSGMTVATLLFTCLIFLAMGWVAPADRMTALSVAAIVAIAAPVGGATSQDLKTGYLVGATPIYQQIAILFGSLASAIVIGYILQVLNTASTVYTKQNLPTATVDVSQLSEREPLVGPDAKHDNASYLVYHVNEIQTAGPLAGLAPGKYLVNDNGSFAYRIDPGINGTSKTRDDGTPVQKYEAPKARLMSLIIDGILTQKLPWGLVLLGVFISLVLELCGISSLAFAVGVYLPIAVSTPIFVGGMLRWLAEKWSGKQQSASESESAPGVLLSSGLIAGGAIGGIGIAMTALDETFLQKVDLSAHFALANTQWFAVFVFSLLAIFTLLVGAGKILQAKDK